MINDIFKDNPNSQCIKIFTGGETIQDPYEKNVEVSLFTPTIIQAIVTDLVASQISWKLPGVRTSRVKEIYVLKGFRSLIENSQRIDIIENGKTINFEGWRVNGKMQIRQEGDLLRLYVYSRTVDTP